MNQGHSIISAGFFAVIFLSVIFSACADTPIKPENSSAKFPVKNITTPATRNLGLDKSPMDMIYCPADFPITKMAAETNELPQARVIYSRPRKEGRKVFGELVQMGIPWRLGANESTELELFRDAVIQDQAVSRGRYTLYAIPQHNFWTIRFNKNLYTWGLNPDSTYDAFSFNLPVYSSPKSLEVFSMEFSSGADTAGLHIGWDTVRVTLPIHWR